MPEDATSAGRVAVIGVGNILMGDDGIGVAVIEALRKEDLPGQVELYDAGIALSDVLATIGDCARVILVDSCKAGEKPGTIYRSTCRSEEWETTSLGDSLHDINVVHALQLHHLAGGNLGEVVLVGIEPKEFAFLHEGLSSVLQERLPAILQAVRDELAIPSELRRGGTR
ncbi:MAG: hydrogenase maturation protease [Pseudomonadota bacterium]